MKFKLISIVAFLVFILNNTQAQKIVIADSVNTVGLYSEIEFINKKQNFRIEFGPYFLDFGYNKKNKEHSKKMHAPQTVSGFVIVKKGKRKLSKLFGYWVMPVIENLDSFKIYINAVKDSTTNYIAFYVNQSTTKKWKYIGTIKDLDTNKIKKVSLEIINNKNNLTFKNTWLQVPTRKGWIALDTNINKTPPVMRPFSNVDSLPQITIEQKIIADSLKNTAIAYKGLFYTMLQEGTGATVNVTDSVTIFYKGSLFSNGNIFDQTKDKPITFPLNGLIQGWQIGVPLCKVGGKIRLYIPSGFAYGIRNLSAEIPPNSTLVFDIEVVDAKGN